MQSFYIRVKKQLVNPLIEVASKDFLYSGDKSKVFYVQIT